MIYQGHIEGDVTILKGDDASALTSIGGVLSIHADGASMPALTSIGGWLGIHAEGASLPALTRLTYLAERVGHESRMTAVYDVGEGPRIRLGCFVGDRDDAVAAIRIEHGAGSDYERVVVDAFERHSNVG